MSKYISLENLERYDAKMQEHFASFCASKEDGMWRQTEKAGAVQFWPVGNSPLEGTVEFLFKETPPASGEKSPTNPSTITSVSNISISVCGKNLAIPYTNPYFTLDSNGWYEALIDNTSGSSTVYATVYIHPTLIFDTSKQYCAVIESENCDPYWLFSNNTSTQKPRLYYSGGGGFRIEGTNKYKCNLSFNNDPIYRIVRIVNGVNPGDIKHFKFRFSILQCSANEVDLDNYVYEKPVINTGSISLGNAYYGGSIDLATGVMTVTHGVHVFDGTESVTYQTNELYRNNESAGIYVGNSSLIGIGVNIAAVEFSIACDKLPVTTPTTGGSNFTSDPESIYKSSGASLMFRISNSRLASYGYTYGSSTSSEALSAFRSWLADNRVTMIYKLSIPQTVQLTAPQIRSLIQPDKYVPRLNTVYSDAENVQIVYQKNPVRDKFEKVQAIIAQGGNV